MHVEWTLAKITKQADQTSGSVVEHDRDCETKGFMFLKSYLQFANKLVIKPS